MRGWAVFPARAEARRAALVGRAKMRHKALVAIPAAPAAGPGSGGAPLTGGSTGSGGNGLGGNTGTGGAAGGTAGNTDCGTSGVVTCPDLPGAERSTLYSITANGAPLFVEKLSKFSPEMQVHYAHASLSGTGAATIAVTVSETFSTYKLSPKSRQISATKSGNTITFSSGPNYLILQVDSKELLFILLDAEEVNPPHVGDANVKSLADYRGQHGRDAGDVEDPVGHQRRFGRHPEYPLCSAREVQGRRAVAQEQHDDVSRLRRHPLWLAAPREISTPAAAGSTSKGCSTR
jgi:hypothetical protein